MPHVLVVCTANICRSPMAEAILRSQMTDPELVVSSAGVRALVGRPVCDGAIDALARVGLDLPEHVARQADDAIVDAADLVLTMEVDHLTTLVAAHPDRFGRTFTFKEFADRVTTAGPRASRPFDEWLAAVGKGRSRRSLLGANGLDVSDPYGGPRAGYRKCATELDRLCSTVSGHLVG